MLAAFITCRRADAEDDEEFFDPSDFDEEEAARSERAGAAFTAFCLDTAAAIMEATWFAFFCLHAASVIRVATSSALIPSAAAIPPLLALFVDPAALHSHDAIYLLEGDNVGRCGYPP
jgi:hypothetical protein